MSTNRASEPRTDRPDSDVTAGYLEQVIRLLGTAGGGTPEQRLEAVAETLRGTAWKSYRAGRVRLAGLTGMYWEWLSPADAEFLGGTGTPIAWRARTGVFADVVVCDADLDDDVTIERVGLTARTGATVHGHEFIGVRVLPMARPGTALFHTPDGASTRIDPTAELDVEVRCG